MLNKILNLLGGWRMIVEPSQTEELFGGSASGSPSISESSDEKFGAVVEAREEIHPPSPRFQKVTVALGTAAFSMSVDPFNSQLG